MTQLQVLLLHLPAMEQARTLRGVRINYRELACVVRHTRDNALYPKDGDRVLPCVATLRGL